jgi:triosephosphate isomerase (TIM)
MSRTPLIVGNWKMYTSLPEARALAAAIADKSVPGIETVICPPFLWLVPLAEQLSGSNLALGAQDCWPEPEGSFTGNVAAAMLAPLCRWVIVGHSERRAIHGEDDELIARKLAAALEVGLTPILCLGETATQRAEGEAESTIARQLRAALATAPAAQIPQVVIAYEPVWAIGSGDPATVDDAAAMARLIRSELSAFDDELPHSVRILYGGSVNSENAGGFFEDTEIDGALVGGASLDAGAFNAIRVRAVGWT